MEKNFKRVLQVNAGSKNYGGVSAMIYQIYKNIDKKIFQFDFVSPIKTTYELKRHEIENMGGRIFELNISGDFFKKKVLLFLKLKKLINMNNYDIVHINSGAFFFNLEVAIIAKICHVKKIIIHSHNGLNPNKKFKNFIIKLCKPLLKFFGTDFLTCSYEASIAMYTNKMIRNNEITMIPNGIETQKFKFDQDKRDEYRTKLNVKDKFVLGNIGRFSIQKNHKFLLQIFYQLKKINNNAVLLFIGEGELKDEIEDLSKTLNIQNDVFFLGIREDIPNLLMAMDMFILPSLHEGLPVVGIEAQASGLELVLSDTITREVQVTDNVKFISLKNNEKEWANEINKLSKKSIKREEVYSEVEESGFDILKTVKRIEEIYLM